MNVIINADDLGYSVDTNKIIFSLINEKLVTSASIIVNGPGFEDVVKNFGNYNNCSFGIHLNLSEFSSLTKSKIFYDKKIIDEKGVFTSHLESIKANGPLLQAIYSEWESQVIKLLDNGIKPTHIDSHKLMHSAIPRLFYPLKKIQKKFNIRHVRPLNTYFFRENKMSPIFILKRHLWNWALRNIVKTKTTDYFVDFTEFLYSIKKNKFPKEGSIELMCHPGTDYRPDEESLLRSNWQSDLPFPIKLISFKEL